jgi:hypothetical protein
LLAAKSGGKTLGMGPRNTELVIPPDPRFLRELRARTRAVLQSWGVQPPVLDAAVIAAHELSSNAMLHTKADAMLRLIPLGDRIRIEVSDLSTAEPRRSITDPAELEHGIGLNVVANLTDAWGHHPSECGKTVWCELLTQGLFVEVPGHPA